MIEDDDGELREPIPPEVLAHMAFRDMIESYRRANPLAKMGITAVVAKVVSTGIVHGKIQIGCHEQFMIARLSGEWLRSQALSAQAGGAQSIASSFLGALTARPPLMQKLLADVLAQAMTAGVLDGAIALEADQGDILVRIPRAWFMASGNERLLDAGTA